MRRLLAVLATALCLAMLPATALAAPSVAPNANSIYANGCAIEIVAGTAEGRTNIIYDGKYLKIRDSEPTDAGYDLSGYTIYGGSSSGSVASTDVTMTGGTVYHVFGGGHFSTVAGDTNLVINGGTVRFSAYGGGGRNSIVEGDVNVFVDGGNIGSVYAGAQEGTIGGFRKVVIRKGASGDPVISKLRMYDGDLITVAGGVFNEFSESGTPVLKPGTKFHEYTKSTGAVGDELADYAAAKAHSASTGDGGWVIVKAPEYKVTYSAPDATSGTAPADPRSYLSGDTATVLGCELTRTGYAFDGWNTSEDGTGTTHFPGETIGVAADVTLYAQWKPIEYAVRFDANGGDGSMPDQAFAYDESKALSLNEFSRAGHSFDGWADASGSAYADGATVENLASTDGAVVELTAQWTPESYAVIFDADGGSDVAPQTVEYGQAAAEPEEPTKSGHAFAGWFADSTLTIPYDFSAPVTASVTIYAKWDAVYYPIIVPTPKPCPLNDYDDLDRSAWYHDGVCWAIERGIMTGTREGIWEPEGITTRAMVAAVLYRMEGEPNRTGEGAWYADAMRWAVENGVFLGYGNDPTDLGPNDPITREQLAVVLWRYAGHPSASADLSDYPDADAVSAWAEYAMRWAVSEGIITGRGGTLLAPGGETERAEFAAMLHRLMK